ncbi:MAG: glycosyltransferase family 4 protein [Candidatus Obscuribacterales bacterium]|nr:glycosyltransferase family 4 protein [Cyanobacteria bacterium SZAS LIN-5]
MRVGIISASFPPDFGWDGGATRAYELAMGLKAAGHEVEIFALAAEIESVTIQDGMRVHRVLVDQKLVQLKVVPKTTPNVLTIWSSRSALWKAFLKAHAQRPFEVLDIPNILWDGLLPSISGMVPVVVRLQQNQSLYDKESIGAKSAFSLDSELVNQFSDLTLSMAEKIYSPTKELAAALVPSNPDKVDIVADPIDMDRFTVYGAMAMPKDSDRKLVIVGKVRDKAVHKYMCDVIKGVNHQNHEIPFLILAEDITSDDDEHHAQESVKGLLGEHNPVIVTRAYHQLLPDLLRSAQYVLVAPGSERVPYSWLEPMACQRAVIANSDPGCEQYMRAGEDAVLVKPFDVKASVNAVLELFEDRALRLKVGISGCRVVHESHCRRRVMGKLEDIYRAAIDNYRSEERAAARAMAMHDFVQRSEALVASYDKMLYDLLFVESPEFRFRHWFTKVAESKSPAAPIASTVAKIFGVKHTNGNSSPP